MKQAAGAGRPGDAAPFLRRFPYPYRAMLAICSDLDETPDRQVYWEIARFLNTAQETSMGPGVGLEVGNSIYFDMPPTEFAYWNTDDAGRAMVRALIGSGHIDCLHSFGDLAKTRGQAARALDEVAGHGGRLEVWVDHGTALTNFGEDIMQGQGDIPGCGAYHADLSCGHGIRYIWRGRVTSVIGQDVARKLGGLFRWRHPWASGRTVLKEGVKGVLAGLGSSKYSMHGPNRVLCSCELRDGQRVFEFIRCNPHWGGVSCGETGRGLAEVLKPVFLDRLVERGGVCVLYTHLGKISRRDEPLEAASREALRCLARYAGEGRILVTTTRRLLGFCRAMREVSARGGVDGQGPRIEIDASGVDLRSMNQVERSDLAGLALYVDDPESTRVFINGVGFPDVRRNGPDHTGRGSVSLPWAPLEFPDL